MHKISWDHRGPKYESPKANPLGTVGSLGTFGRQIMRGPNLDPKMSETQTWALGTVGPLGTFGP